MTLIGITGTNGAGKGTITNYLVREHGFVYVSVSEFLADEAERRGLTPDRPTRRDIANDYRAQGPTALMEATYASIPAGALRVVLEPQHTLQEVRYVQSQGGMVLALDADLEKRYERIFKRGSPKDSVSFEEFKSSQLLEMKSDDPNRNNLSAAIGAADMRLTNNGTIEELEHAAYEVLHAKNILQ